MTDKDAPSLGVGMVGYAFMGAAHSQAWRTAGRFFDLPSRPGHGRAVRAQRRRRPARRPAARLGARRDRLAAAASTRDDVQLVDICTPGDTHAEIAIAALEAGKHVLCEKPLANTVDEAEAMVAAAARARRAGRALDGGLQLSAGPGDRSGPRAGRRGPARARSGTCGRSTCRTGSSTRSSRWSGGCRRSEAGSGALGDIGAHIIDLAQFVTGQLITGVSGLTETFVKERPLPDGVERPARLRGAATSARSRSTTRRCSRPGSPAGRSAASRRRGSRRDARTRCASRSTGRAGSLAFDFESMNELAFYDGTEDARTAGLPPHPGHRADASRTSARGGRPATGSATSTRSPTRSSTWCATSPPAVTRGRRSPTGCRCSGCSPRWRPRPPTTADGRTSM